MGWGMIADIVNKLLPSRKAALVDRMRELEAQYADALKGGRDTEAAALRVQLKDLRTKVGFSDEDI